MVVALSACQSVYAKILDHPPRLFGDPYFVTKVCADPIWRFEMIVNLIFSVLASNYLRNSMGCLEVIRPLTGVQSQLNVDWVHP